MNRQRARLNEPPAARTTSRTATIIHLPAAAPARRSRRPSLALNIVLIVLLVLACVVWEAISARKEHAHEPHGTPVTSPRAAVPQDVA